jgi:hypothetical protein
VLSQWALLRRLHTQNAQPAACPQVPLVLATTVFNTLIGLPMASCAFHTPGARVAELARAACRATTRGPSLLMQLPLSEFDPASLLKESELCSADNSSTLFLLFLNILVGGRRRAAWTWCGCCSASWCCRAVAASHCGSGSADCAWRCRVASCTGLMLHGPPLAQVGTFLPLVIVYRSEWTMKRTWARAAGYDVPPITPLTLPVCLGVLALLAVLSLVASQLMQQLPMYDLSRCSYDYVT